MRQMTIEQSRRHLAWRKRKSRVFGWACMAAVMIGVAMLIALLSKIAIDGASRVNWSFLTSFANPDPKLAGIKASIVGSLAIMVLTTIITVPIGVAAAIYLQEFASRRSRFVNFIEVNIANLSAVPSIVYGLLGLAVFVTWLQFGKSVLSGALTMSLLVLPMIILVSQEALKAVPSSYREGALALGATRWQTIRRQVLPSAAPGIFTGIILSVSRAIGETAPLIVVGAVGYAAFVPTRLSDRYTVMPLQIFDWSKRPQVDFQHDSAGAIIVLMLALLALNAVAILLRNRALKKR